MVRVCATSSLPETFAPALTQSYSSSLVTDAPRSFAAVEGAKKQGMIPLCVGCALIDMFVKRYGDLGSAQKVFDKMPERNVVAWSLMISRLVQMGFLVDAVKLFLDY